VCWLLCGIEVRAGAALIRCRSRSLRNRRYARIVSGRASCDGLLATHVPF